jgi:hypothetical protein
LGQVTDAVQHDQVGCGLHAVHAVVELGRQTVDVLAVERGDERGVHLEHDRVGGLVSSVLDVSYPRRHGLALGALGTHQIGQPMGAMDQVVSQRCEKCKEAVFVRSETKTTVRLRWSGMLPTRW